MCTQCRHDLPLTNFHGDHENAVHKVLYGRVKLINATALLHFSKKGIVQQLMHNLKYRGHEQIGHILGLWLGEELKHLKILEKQLRIQKGILFKLDKIYLDSGRDFFIQGRQHEILIQDFEAILKSDINNSFKEFRNRNRRN
jgi:hypothetical protein